MAELPDRAKHVSNVGATTSGDPARVQPTRWRYLLSLQFWGVIAVLAILFALSLRVFLRGQALDYFDQHDVTYTFEPIWCDSLLNKMGRFGDGFRSVSEVNTVDTDEYAIHLLGRFPELRRIEIHGAIHSSVFPVLRSVEEVSIESYESQEMLLVLERLPNVSRIKYRTPRYSVSGTPAWALPPEPLLVMPPPSLDYHLENLDELFWHGYSGADVQAVVDLAPHLNRLEFENASIPVFRRGGVGIRFKTIEFSLDSPTVRIVEVKAFDGPIRLLDCRYVESLAVDSFYSKVDVGTQLPPVEGITYDIVTVGSCPRLRTAAIGCGYMIIRLNDLPSLEHLVLVIGANSKGSDLSLSLAATDSIRAIDFEQADGPERIALSAESVSQICSLPKLEYLNLSGLLITPQELQAFQEISTLRFLRLPTCFGETDDEPIDLVAVQREFLQPGIQIEVVPLGSEPSYWRSLPFHMDLNSDD